MTKDHHPMTKDHHPMTKDTAPNDERPPPNVIYGTPFVSIIKRRGNMYDIVEYYLHNAV